MQRQPTVSVIITNYNGASFLIRALASVLQEEERDFEIILVDDCSEDNSLSLVESKFGCERRLRLIRLEKNVGVAEARNIGARSSKGKFLFFLDNDTKLKKGWFQEIKRFFRRFQGTGAAQVKLLKMGTKNFDYAGDLITPFCFLAERARSVADRGQFDQNDRIFAGKSAGMIVRREVFDTVGGFDSDYRIFWEDTDFFWRVWLSGWEVRFLPSVVVWHAYGTGEKKLDVYLRNKIFLRGCANMLTSLVKNLEAARLFVVLPIVVISWLILAGLFLLRLRVDRGWAIVNGLFLSLVNLPATLKKRKTIQKQRKISDRELFATVGTTRTVTYYFGKAYAYITGKPF